MMLTRWFIHAPSANASHNLHGRMTNGGRVAGGLWMPEAAALSALRRNIDKKPHQIKSVLSSSGIRKEFLGGVAKDEAKLVKRFVSEHEDTSLKTRPKVSLYIHQLLLQSQYVNKTWPSGVGSAQISVMTISPRYDNRWHLRCALIVLGVLLLKLPRESWKDDMGGTSRWVTFWVATNSRSQGLTGHARAPNFQGMMRALSKGNNNVGENITQRTGTIQTRVSHVSILHSRTVPDTALSDG